MAWVEDPRASPLFDTGDFYRCGSFAGECSGDRGGSTTIITTTIITTTTITFHFEASTISTISTTTVGFGLGQEKKGGPSILATLGILRTCHSSRGQVGSSFPMIQKIPQDVSAPVLTSSPRALLSRVLECLYSLPVCPPNQDDSFHRQQSYLRFTGPLASL